MHVYIYIIICIHVSMHAMYEKEESRKKKKKEQNIYIQQGAADVAYKIFVHVRNWSMWCTLSITLSTQNKIFYVSSKERLNPSETIVFAMPAKISYFFFFKIQWFLSCCFLLFFYKKFFFHVYTRSYSLSLSPLHWNVFCLLHLAFFLQCHKIVVSEYNIYYYFVFESCFSAFCIKCVAKERWV